MAGRLGLTNPIDSKAPTQRVDKWLWFARVVKSRSLGTKLVAAGYVRLNGARITVPARPVGIGDVLTIALERRVLVLRVTNVGARRGPATEARGLFEELGAPDKPAA